MSDATFSSPTGPTTGLQGYDLEKPVKNLFPMLPIRVKANADAARHLARKRRLHMRKDHPMDAIIEAMTGTLSKSVADIIEANPENRDELLAKTFGEFQAALEAEVVGELEKLAPEEPLFKGLGAVGKIANLVSYVSREVSNIQSGKEWSGQEKLPADADPASDGVAELLDHMVAVGELALRAAVNEHVDIADDDDDGDEEGMHILHLPIHGDEGHHVVVKTALPEDLAKFATDPMALQEGIVTLGTSFLLDGGVPVETMEKVLGGDDLNKAFPPKKKPEAEATQETDAAPAEGEAEQGNDQEGAADQVDQGMGEGDPENDGDIAQSITIAQRLAAAMMIQLEHVLQQLQGASPETAEEVDGTQDEPMQQSVKTGKLAKAADEKARLEGELAELKKKVEDLSRQPAPAKGLVNAGPALAKNAETGGVVEDELAKEAARIDALPEDMRRAAMAEVLMKQALRAPRPLIGGVGALAKN